MLFLKTNLAKLNTFFQMHTDISKTPVYIFIFLKNEKTVFIFLKKIKMHISVFETLLYVEKKLVFILLEKIKKKLFYFFIFKI